MSRQCVTIAYELRQVQTDFLLIRIAMQAHVRRDDQDGEGGIDKAARLTFLDTREALREAAAGFSRCRFERQSRGRPDVREICVAERACARVRCFSIHSRREALREQMQYRRVQAATEQDRQERQCGLP
jgi:hypothetical protein